MVFQGGAGGSPPEEGLLKAQKYISLDLLRRARLRNKILVTDSTGLAGEAKDLAQIEICGSPFHFGRSLQYLINKYSLERPIYAGGGFPLLSSLELGSLAGMLKAQENCVAANNYYSADLIAFTPGSAINSVELTASDNPLARLLHEQAGLRFIALPRSVSNQFDVDTPTDLLLLGLHPAWRDRVSDWFSMDDSRLRAALACLKDKDAEVIVYGRVNSYVWSKLESQTKCRIRLWAEERGLKSEERLEQKKARSLAGFLIEKEGAGAFFKALEEMGSAAFIDSRVIFAHFGLDVSRKDRFYSDLGNYQDIENEFVRDFTRASVECSIPVILGGHSLVSGGMLLLLEMMANGI